MKEDEIVLLVRSGDKSAFASLFDRYSPRLYGFSMRYLHNSSDAEEIVQDTFIKIWEIREKIDPAMPFSNYLISIAKNRIYDIIKHKFVEKKHRDGITRSMQQGLSDEDKYLWDDIVQLMLTSMENLPARQREILLMRSQGYTNSEIAERLNISLRTVETHFSRGLVNLRTVMGGGNSVALALFFASFY